jgi:predicted SAM-dependent methyltransferase
VRILPPTEFNPATTHWFNVNRRFRWPTDSIDAIYAGELLEHFTPDHGEHFLRECHRVLKPGGTIRIRVPDNARFWANYLQEYDAMKARARGEWRLDHTRWIQMFFHDICVRRTVLRSMGHYHKWMYDEISLIKTLERVGFESIARMEYLDSRIPDIGSVEVRDDLIVEAAKPATTGHHPADRSVTHSEIASR